MHRTIFQTPVVSSLFRALFGLGQKACGWRVVDEFPPEAARCVVIGAPHTSNWDLPVALMAAFHWRLNAYWMGKDSIFRFPFGALMRWLGGVAVDRSRSNNATQAIADALTASPGPVQLIISPEGTRKRVDEWKTGFYYIALQAKLPIFISYADYEKKHIGHFGLFTPTGDMQADMQHIRSLYANVEGKNPGLFGG
jgi:1-acyl-sn-glycerol-3-phosphate acyltransferase